MDDFRDLMYDIILESLVDKLENYEITMEDAEIFSEAAYDELYSEAKNKGEFGFFGQRYYDKHKADYVKDLDPQIESLHMQYNSSKNPEEQRKIMQQIQTAQSAKSNLINSQSHVNDAVANKAHNIDAAASMGGALAAGAAVGGAAFLAKRAYEKHKNGQKLLEEARSMTPKSLMYRINIYNSNPKLYKQELAIFKKVLAEKQQGR